MLIAGGMLLFSTVKRLIVPGLVEFLLITLAHLLVAIAVVGLARLAIRSRALGLTLGILWGAGWMTLFIREATMLLFYSPPAWMAYGDWLLVLAGVATGVAGVVLYRDSALADIGCPSWVVLTFAVLSSLFVWFGLGLGNLGVDAGVVFAVRMAEEALLALSVLGTGLLLMMFHRRSRPNAPEPLVP